MLELLVLEKPAEKAHGFSFTPSSRMFSLHREEVDHRHHLEEVDHSMIEE